jgi:hypothetical protein
LHVFYKQKNHKQYITRKLKKGSEGKPRLSFCGFFLCGGMWSQNSVYKQMSISMNTAYKIKNRCHSLLFFLKKNSTKKMHFIRRTGDERERERKKNLVNID